MPEHGPRPVFRLGDRIVDLERRRVSRFDGDVSLTGAEAALLEALYHAGGAPLDRAELTTGLLGFSPRARTRTLDTLLWRLRARIEADPSEPRYLVSLRQKGLALLGVEKVARNETADIIGRETERARLLEWLSRPGLVQVVAPAGFGKSALMRALVADAVSLFGAGTQIVTLDLTSVAGPGSLGTALVARFGMDPQALGDLGAAMAVRGPTWLLLDGCEVMSDAVAELLGRMMPRAPELRVAVFSRVLLPFAGGHSLELEPLTPDASRRLIAALCSTRVVSDDQLEKAVAVAAGIPLALELTAANILAGHPIGATDVAAALEAALERSWQYLTAVARDDLIHVAMMHGAFDLSLATAVLDRSKTRTVDAIEVLRRHSLLDADSNGRFRVPEPVRALVGRMATESHERARRRHASIFCDIATGPLNRGRWAQLRRCAVDLHAALLVLDAWASSDANAAARHAQLVVGLVPLATHGGLIAVETLQQHAMRAWTRKPEPSLAVSIACVHIELALHGLDLQTAEVWLAPVRHMPNPAIASLLARFAIISGVEGEIALRLGQILTTTADGPEKAELLARIGAMHGRFGRMREAAAAFEACLALPAESRWPGLDVEVRQQLATAYIIMRPGMPGPERLYAEARRMAEEAGLYRYVPVIVANRTTYHYLAGDTEAALASAHEALALARRSGRGIVVAQALVALAGVALRHGDAARASESLVEARSHAAGDTQQNEQIAHLEVLLALFARDAAKAHQALARVGTLATRPPLDGLVALHRALTAWLDGEPDEMQRHLSEARRRAEPLGRADVTLAMDLATTLAGGAGEVPPPLFRRWQRLDAKPGQTGMAAEQIRLLLQWFDVRSAGGLSA